MTRIEREYDRMVTNVHSSEIEAFAAEVKKFHEAEIADATPAKDRAQFIVLPEGKRVESLKAIIDSFRDRPERRKGRAGIADLASFINHVLRFKGADTVVFANPTQSAPTLTAVYDYHPAGDDISQAAWLGHQAIYAPKLSDAWAAWFGNNGKWVPQDAFAAFIEDHVSDLIAPDGDQNLVNYAALVQGSFAAPGDLVALSRGLQVNVASTVKNANNLTSGEIAIRYEEVHQDGAGQPLNIKNLFVIAVPVFYAGQFYRIPARLRYRIGADKKLSWSYALVRLDKVFEDAFSGLVGQVEEATGVPVFVGAPEQQ